MITESMTTHSVFNPFCTAAEHTLYISMLWYVGLQIIHLLTSLYSKLAGKLRMERGKKEMVCVA
jgi:hypothetical protein